MRKKTARTLTRGSHKSATKEAWDRGARRGFGGPLAVGPARHREKTGGRAGGAGPREGKEGRAAFELRRGRRPRGSKPWARLSEERIFHFPNPFLFCFQNKIQL